MGTAQRTYRNVGMITCGGVQTVYMLTAETLATALDLPAGTPTRFFADNEKSGWNQVTIGVTGISAKTWKVEAAIGPAWFELDAGLATDVTLLTHGVGPQVGVHESATPSFRQLPAFRADAYRVTLSAADAAGRIHIVAEFIE